MNLFLPTIVYRCKTTSAIVNRPGMNELHNEMAEFRRPQAHSNSVRCGQYEKSRNLSRVPSLARVTPHV